MTSAEANIVQRVKSGVNDKAEGGLDALSFPLLAEGAEGADAEPMLSRKVTGEDALLCEILPCSRERLLRLPWAPSAPSPHLLLCDDWSL